MSYRINVPEGTANTMKLTILGATGATGIALTGQALAAGHEVTAVVRDPARLAVPAQPRLRTVTADVMAGVVERADRTKVQRAIELLRQLRNGPGQEPHAEKR